MKAAHAFLQRLLYDQLISQVKRVRVDLYGSLAATGRGHGTHTAVMLGLMGHLPETVNLEQVPLWLEEVAQDQQLKMTPQVSIYFSEERDIHFLKKELLPFHTNGMRFFAFSEQGDVLLEKTYFSIGGGFILEQNEQGQIELKENHKEVPYPFVTGFDLLNQCERLSCSVAYVVKQNELQFCSEEQLKSGILNIWNTMKACIDRGLNTEGFLPGGLKIPRRAAKLFQQLNASVSSTVDPLLVLEWVNAFAMAVNEENACGGRVVTAPTNGAAGIIPAVLFYYLQFVLRSNDQSENEEKIIDFLLTATAIGALYKNNASISGAEVGCQGEVGVACSMAAGALCAVLGGTVRQVENAAEIGMEHNLGLTCDPVGGRVQVPCIERNAMGAVKAINAARLALRGDGKHVVSLDQVIKTMRETGADMKAKYKETSRGGLAVNVVEC
jgi:L-serine dehydratase